MTAILIAGTGALATLFAARLSAAGHSVCMLGSWQNGLRSLRSRGARLVDREGREQAFPVSVTDDPAEIRAAGLALVLVKSWQTERAAEQLARCLTPGGLAVTLQNGIGNREQLVEALGAERVALGTTTTGATLLGPGLVRAGGEGTISIEGHPALGPLHRALRSAGFRVRVIDDAGSLIWGKLVINAAINPLTALLHVTNGELLKRPAARGLMAELAQETAAIAAAERVHLPFEDPVAAAEEVARDTAGNHSSMFQDVRRGARTEIDAICGAVTARGQRYGIPTPVNSACWRLVRALAGD
ncbi:MAG: ketopantoate reductase family protein [Bacteroidota bacterium]